MLRIKTLLALILAAACGLAVWLPSFEAPGRRDDAIGRGGSLRSPQERPTGCHINIDSFKC
jgi:hypothetical protein